MTVLVFGGNGQLGELLRSLAPLGEVVATTRSGQLADGGPCEVADFNAPDALAALLGRIQPTVVVNAAAYTAVDRAEGERDAAWRANAEAPGVIARWCAAAGVPLVHSPPTTCSMGRAAVRIARTMPPHRWACTVKASWPVRMPCGRPVAAT